MNKYEELQVGQIVKDNKMGCEWIVREKIPGGVRLQINKEGGPFIDATPENCLMKFEPCIEGRRIWNRDKAISGIIQAKTRRYCAACQRVHDSYIVLWDNGMKTKPCTAGVEFLENGDLHIM